MVNVKWILIVAALVQCSFGLLLDKSGRDLDKLQKKVIPGNRRKILKNFVRIVEPNAEAVRHVIGTPLQLNCAALGFPAPAIHWLKNGERIRENAEAEEVSKLQTAMRPTLGVLYNNLITVPETDDVFTCVATAGAKVTTSDTKIIGIEAGDNLEASLAYQKEYTLKPRIVSYFEGLFVETKTTGPVVLPCRVQSYGPRQDIYWEMNDQPVYDNPNYTMLPNGDLLISDMTWADMGQYTCYAKNLYGTDSVDTFLYPTFMKQ